MGIMIQGVTTDDFLSSVEVYHGNYKSAFEAALKREDEAWKHYLALQDESRKAELKSIYVDALRRGKSLEWARGKAEGRGLDPDKFEDEEVQAICGLF